MASEDNDTDVSSGDVNEVDKTGKITPKRRFDRRDWAYIAENVVDTYATRKRARKDRELHWKEVDRQIAMEPDTKHKLMPDGKVDSSKAWMAEMELPLQAQALEVLTADARRMLFPGSRPWFVAQSAMTDAYLAEIDFTSIILGDETDVPSQFNQDNVDKLVAGFLTDQFRQYDFYTRIDRINAEAFKYGIGVGRARMQNMNMYEHENQFVFKQARKIPVLHPCSIKNVYLDEPLPSMHSAEIFGDAHISEDFIKHSNLAVAASRGSSEPTDMDGGWMAANMKDIEPDKDGYVQILEMEGDIIVPRKTSRSIVIPGAIVTVVVGGKDKGGNVTKGVIRFRFRHLSCSSFLLFPYHYEGTNDKYPTSPLQKGRPVQMLSTDALNRLMDSAALKNQPPVGYDKSDLQFAAEGGPEIYPGAQWATTDEVRVYNQIGGEPAAMASVMAQGISLYAELTGVLPARLGAQTVSHTTAFAKDAEIQRGALRTVDYVDTIGQGPLTRWLNMAYAMGRESMGSKPVQFYIDAYGGYVEITKKYLPELCSFKWFGSGGPAEEASKLQKKMQSLQVGLQMDAIGQQTGNPPTINLPAAISAVLREGGWTDLDVIINQRQAMQPQLPANPAAQTVALQALTPEG
jgi:hypothetical protein